MMKTPLFCVIAAAAAFSASAAVVSFTWSGTGTAGAYSITGQFDIGAASGPIIDSDIVYGATTFWSATGTAAGLPFSNVQLDPTSSGIEFNTTNFGAGITSANLSLGDANGITLTGAPGFAAFDFGDNNGPFNDTGGDNNLALVPEPEMMAAVAGALCLAIGIRRARCCGWMRAACSCPH